MAWIAKRNTKVYLNSGELISMTRGEKLPEDAKIFPNMHLWFDYHVDDDKKKVLPAESNGDYKKLQNKAKIDKHAKLRRSINTTA